MSASPDQSWTRYLADFHRARPGITEDVLGQSRSAHGLTPYDWVTAPIPLGARTLDLACGSGPGLRVRPSEPWVGVDRSSSELARAVRSGSSNVLQADAGHLPFADASFDGVVCSMALMLVQPLERTVAEVLRVLAPDGLFVVTMPGSRPLRVRDVARYAVLLGRLDRARLAYPNGCGTLRWRARLRRGGFEVIEDTRTRFDFALTSPEHAQLFVASLYLPGVSRAALARAERLAATWVGSDIGIPLRRLTLARRSKER